MSLPIKNGKKALSERIVSKQISHDALFGNAFDIPEALKKELEEKGLEARWISKKKVADSQGYHPKSWRPYKSETIKQSNLDFLAGYAPDGYLHRNSLILGVKTKEECNRHRDYNNSKIMKDTDLESDHAERMRKQTGGRVKIVEGSEE